MVYLGLFVCNPVLLSVMFACDSAATSATRSVKLISVCLLLQGDRVWLREDEQYLPSTVSSCSGGVVVFAADYGQVRTVPLR